ncbi:MoxR family ATPase [Streptomyces sp. NPDC002599]|uniref:AAA family ATPase n=1 Tax=Streptomyces sp. NPDC002599 TaxID=3154421 RepID=UPI00332FFDEF
MTVDSGQRTKWVYQGTGVPRPGSVGELPAPPPWRQFDGGPLVEPPQEEASETRRRLGAVQGQTPFRSSDEQVAVINAALYLRRPLLVTGRPGTGKSSLAYRIARELCLGRVLRWSITSRSNLRQGLYEYDAIGRVQAAAARQAVGLSQELPQEPGVEDFLSLGPLGTALLPYEHPRVLLIDEMDKSDIDLPNDLLNVFEDGEFTIPELLRVQRTNSAVTVRTDDPYREAVVTNGVVRARAFPIVVITSNGERNFPAPFLRRCLRLTLGEPTLEELAAMVEAHFPGAMHSRLRELIREFGNRSDREGGLAADQLLNAVHLVTSGTWEVTGADHDETWRLLLDTLWRNLSN